MFQSLDLADHFALTVAVGSLVYATITALAVSVALFARSSTRRRDARRVLHLLLRRRG